MKEMHKSSGVMARVAVEQFNPTPYQMEVNTTVGYVVRLQLAQIQIHIVALCSELLALQILVHRTQLIMACKEHILPTPCSLTSPWSFIIIHAGRLIPWKLANAPNQGLLVVFFFFL